MRFSFPSRLFGPSSDVAHALGGPAVPAPWLEDDSTEAAHEHQSTFLRTLAWVSAGVGALALGLVVGREIRQRYKFTRRTPYDFYAHAGDEHDMEFGVGI